MGFLLCSAPERGAFGLNHSQRRGFFLGSGLAVTVAGYVTPSGRDIQGEGIAPDRLLSEPEPLNPDGEGDRWLNESEQWMEALLEAEAKSELADEPSAA